MDKCNDIPNISRAYDCEVTTSVVTKLLKRPWQCGIFLLKEQKEKCSTGDGINYWAISKLNMYSPLHKICY